MKTFEEILSKIKDNKTPTSHDSYYCLVNMINQVLRLENSITWKEEAYGERCKEIDKLETQVKSYKNKVRELLDTIDVQDETINKMTETIEKYNN